MNGDSLKHQLQLEMVYRKSIALTDPHSTQTIRAISNPGEAMRVSEDSSINKVFTHWSRVTHIYVSKLSIIGSDNEWLVA